MVNPTRRPVPTLGQPFAPGSNNQNTRTTDVNQDLTLCHLHEQQVGNDGNCLFRSVSHQIYGTEDHHELIRRKCVEYMRCNEGWFSQYVAEVGVSGELEFVGEFGEILERINLVSFGNK